MPTHIDVLCGRYSRRRSRATSGRSRPTASSWSATGALNFYTLYRCHDYHFKIYGAMFLGQLEPALEAADEMAATLSEELLRIEVPPMADWAEGSCRCGCTCWCGSGCWQEIIDEPLPADPGLYCTTTAMLHYAKGVAHAATGRHRRRRAQRRAVPRRRRAACRTRRYLFNNTCLDILAVAEPMLDGEIEYRSGNYDAAFDHLRRAVELDDKLPYDEPWGWMQPARHALGALLLEQGHVEEAEAVYRADLGLDDTLRRPCQHPGNVWSLHGYHECLHRLGSCDEADALRPSWTRRWPGDVPIEASCFCRVGAS